MSRCSVLMERALWDGAARRAHTKVLRRRNCTGIRKSATAEIGPVRAKGEGEHGRARTQFWNVRDGVMTFKEARTQRSIYRLLGALTFPLGALTVIATFLKTFYYTNSPALITLGFFKNTAALAYRELFFVRWLWPWMSVANLDSPIGPISLFLCPSIIVGYALVFGSRVLFQNAKRLTEWIKEVKGLLAKEGMRDSLRPMSGGQSTGNVQAGRDANINQHITNHYNQRPDNPKTPFIVAAIGVAGAIVSAIIGALFGK